MSGAYVQGAYVWQITSGGLCPEGLCGLCPGLLLLGALVWELCQGAYDRGAYVLDFCFGSFGGFGLGLCQGAYDRVAYVRGASVQGGFGPGCICQSVCDRGFMSGFFLRWEPSAVRCLGQGASDWGLCSGVFCPRGLWSDGLMSEGI